MKVVYNTWSAAYFNPGGGEVQLESTKSALTDLGFAIERFNQWSPQKDLDIFHQFSIISGVENVVEEYKKLGKKIALSPILWDDFPKDSEVYVRIKKTFDLSDVLMTNSHAESQKLSNSFEVPLCKFHKTRNSISEAFLSMANESKFRKKYNIEDEFVLSVANIDQRKNTERLVAACEELGYSLILIGSIRDPLYYQSIEASHKGFQYLGSITDAEVLKSAYAACRVFALPSLCETPGIAALEAASQRANILITKEGATQEYFGDKDAIYVDPWSLTSIKEGLEKAWRKAINDHLRNWVTSNYTWEKTALDVASGYKKIQI